MSNVIQFPDFDKRASDRLMLFLRGGRILNDDGEMLPEAAKLGTEREWEWTAFRYLQCCQCERSTPAGPGKVEVSIAAIAEVLGLAEGMAIELGIIPKPGGVDAPVADTLAEAIDNSTERLANRALEEGAGEAELSTYLLLKAAVEIVFACVSLEERDAYIAGMPRVITAHAAKLAALDAASDDDPDAAA